MIWEDGLAKLLISAASPSQFPPTDSFEVVMAGRSNVGKSSLINALVNRKNLAYVGQRPGKTRLVNFYQINSEFMLVDVPGYGFANRSMAEQIRYSELMDAYFSSRHQCKGVLVVVDVRRGCNEDDLLMIRVAQEKKLPYLLVATKTDKLSYSKKQKQIRIIEGQSQSMVVGFSTLHQEGIEKIRQVIQRWVQT